MTHTAVQLVNCVRALYRQRFGTSGNLKNEYDAVLRFTVADISKEYRIMAYRQLLYLVQAIDNIGLVSIEELLTHLQGHMRSLVWEIKGNQLMLHYGPNVVYSGAWNSLTQTTRGIIIDISDADDAVILAYPYDKFFNPNERPETQWDALLSNGLDYEDAVKEDGSMGTFYLDGESNPLITTKKRFDTVQGRKGTATLLGKYAHVVPKLATEYPRYTFVFEIIHGIDNPDHLIVNYPDDDLILIGVRDLGSAVMLPYAEVVTWGQRLGLKTSKVTRYSTDELNMLRGTAKNIEGWVRRYADGTYVKLKAEEYLTAFRAYTLTYHKLYKLVVEERWDDYLGTLTSSSLTKPLAMYHDCVDAVKVHDDSVKHYYTMLPITENKKEFAQAVQQLVPTNLQSHMYRQRAGMYGSGWSAYTTWIKFRDATLLPYLGDKVLVELPEQE